MFVVRVELRDVSESKSREVYEKFHASMEKAGFTKKIKGGSGKWYRLPDSTYTISTSKERSSVLETVKTLAAATGYKSGQIVFDWADGQATWSGLEEIPTASNWANA